MSSRRSLKDTIKGEKELADFVFSESTTEGNNSDQKGELKEISVKSIFRTQIQKRRYFDSAKIEEWANSEIRTNGIRSPLWVRPHPNGKSGAYELIAGERRYRAAMVLKKKTVPARVFHLSDKEALIASLVENMQRQDLNPLEETEGTLAAISAELICTDEESVSLLYQMNNASKGKVNQNVLVTPQAEAVIQVFATLGRLSWKSFVASRLPLLNKPPDILEALREGKIEYTKAMLISKLKNDEERKELLEQSIHEGWSLSRIKEQLSLIQDSKESTQSSFETDVKATLKNFRQSGAWKDPKKKRQIERLLAQMKKLIDEKE